MKNFLAICFILLLSILSVSVYASESVFCDCSQKHCICFIQIGDEGKFVSSVIKLLKEQGYCQKNQKVSQFDEGVLSAVQNFQKDHHLPPTGTLDDETLTLIIFGVLPEELDKIKPDLRSDFNWIPTDGGKKRHADPLCCEMLDPRKVSVRNAEALDYAPCKVCNKSDLPIE